MNAMRLVTSSLVVLSAVLLTAAAPRHVLTADYWGGYAGTHNVPAERAAQWLWLAETDPQDTNLLAPLGVKTMLYTNPNREMPHDPMWSDDDSEFAHTCSGGRARGESQYANILLTNPASAATKHLWKTSVASHFENAHFDFVFADEADGAAYAADQPCGYALGQWLRDEASLFDSLHEPIIYNALGDFAGHDVAPEIALNAHAAGGMMEECYAQLHPENRVGGWRWFATELTELRMAAAHKYFICYGRDLTPADQAHESRMYTYASFLLSYDPATTILWEYYKTPSGGHVMPESQLVALDPEKRVTRVAQLRERGGAYVRRYRRCFLDSKPAGPCVAAVNPDDTERSVDLRGYGRVLQLHGSGIFDGGSVSLGRAGDAGRLEPLGAVIAFK